MHEVVSRSVGAPRSNARHALPGVIVVTLICVAATLSAVTASAGVKHDQGTWTNPFNLFPTGAFPYNTSNDPQDVGVHGALLHETGSSARLLYWGTSFTARRWTYDPVARDQSVFAGTLTALTATDAPPTPLGLGPNSDIFCSGHTVLANGNPLVLGGVRGVGWDPRNWINNNPQGLYDIGKATYWTGTSSNYEFMRGTNSWASRPNSPTGRYYPSATTLSDGRVLLSSGNLGNPFISIGGETAISGGPTADLRVLQDFETLLPTNPAFTSPNGPPPAVADCAVAYDPPGLRTIVFGGKTSSTAFSSSVWVLSRNDQSAVVADQTKFTYWPFADRAGTFGKPGVRALTDGVYDQSSSVTDGGVVIFGGSGGTPAAPIALNDLWRLRLDARSSGNPGATGGIWERLHDGTGTAPAARFGHSMVLIPNPNQQPSPAPTLSGWLVLFGGRNAAGTYVNDGSGLWVCDLSQAIVQWQFLPVDPDPAFPSQGYPSPRDGAVLGYDPESAWNATTLQYPCLILFGGHNASGYLGDTWRLINIQTNGGPGSRWQWMHIGDASWTSNPQPSLNRDWLDSWSAGHQYPSPRARAGLAYDGMNRRHFVLYGGEGASGKLSDIFMLRGSFYSGSTDVNQWVALPPAAPIDARAGQKMVFSPQGLFARTPEVFDPLANTWTTGSSSVWLPMYPGAFQVPEDGKVFVATPSDQSRMLDPTSLSWDVSTVSSDPALAGATSVMFRPGQFMKAGGAPTNSSQDNATTKTATLDLTSGTGATSISGKTWQTSVSSLPTNQGRYHHSLTILPTGQVLASGGTDGKASDYYPPQTTHHSRLTPFIWNPDATTASGTWSAALANMNMPRDYHSIAVLLPDARVLMAGGSTVESPIDPGASTGEIYTPGYLYRSDDTPILTTDTDRPKITTAPTTLGWFGDTSFPLTFTLGAGRTLQKVCLIRAASVTHNVNMDQRFVPLGFATPSGSQVTVYKKTTGYGAKTGGYDLTANIAPPGWYMLFIVDDLGVPSLAKWVQVNCPLVATNLGAGGGRNTIAVSWTEPANIDGSTVDHFEIRRIPFKVGSVTEADWLVGSPVAMPPGPGGPGTPQCVTVGGLNPGTKYIFIVRAVDAGGQLGPLASVIGKTTTNNIQVICDNGYKAQPSEGLDAPAGLELSQPRPHPIQSEYSITFGVPSTKSGEAYELSVLDVAGRRVAVLERGSASAGFHTVSGNLRRSDPGIRPGTYFLRLKVGNEAVTRTVVVLE